MGTANDWVPLEFRRTMMDGSRRHVWTDDGENWSVRIIDAKGTLQHEAINRFKAPENAMKWADTRKEP
jgi:hypothetical protein